MMGAATLTLSQVNAALIASDDFSAEGSGTGFAAASNWGTGNVSGGEYSTGTENFRNFAVTTPSSNTEYWASIEFSLAANSWGGLSFFNGGSEVLLLGRDTGHAFWGIDGRFVADTYSTVAFVADETVHLLARLEFDVNGGGTPDQVSLWVNPSDTTSLATLGTPSATVADNNLGPYTRLRLGTGSSSLTADNLYIGTTLADVTPVPEPSSAALLGLGGLALILRRRK